MVKQKSSSQVPNLLISIELIPVKTYKKGLVFFVAKTVKHITNHLLRLAKLFLR